MQQWERDAPNPIRDPTPDPHPTYPVPDTSCRTPSQTHPAVPHPRHILSYPVPDTSCRTPSQTHPAVPRPRHILSYPVPKRILSLPTTGKLPTSPKFFWEE